jgi:glutathione S-transferase
VIKLYGIPASRASRCLWMLEELGVAYENVPVNFVGDVRKPEFLKLNPNGRIPVLDDDGCVLFESLAINLHLARKYDAGLWPNSQDDQSRAIQWSVWAMTELEPPLMSVLLNRVLLPAEQRDEAKAAAGAQALPKPIAVLDGALAGRETLLGGAFSVADLNVASVLALGAKLGAADLSSAANAAAWLARCTARPAAKRAFAKRA